MLQPMRSPCNPLYTACSAPYHSQKECACLSVHAVLTFKPAARFTRSTTGRFNAAWATAPLASHKRCLPTLTGGDKKLRYVGGRKYNFMHLVLRQRCQPTALRRGLIFCSVAKLQGVPSIFCQPGLGGAMLSSWSSDLLFECHFFPCL